MKLNLPFENEYLGFPFRRDGLGYLENNYEHLFFKPIYLASFICVVLQSIEGGEGV